MNIDNTMKRIAEHLESHHYISLVALRRFIRERCISSLGDLQVTQITENIQDEVPDIRILENADSSSYVKAGVLYSIRWAEEYSPVGTVAEKIGHHLLSVLREDWGNGGCEGVSADGLKARYLDGIICDFQGIPDFSGFRQWSERICLPRPLRKDYLEALDLEAFGETKEAIRKLCEIADRYAYAPAEYRASKLLMPYQHPTREARLANAMFGQAKSWELEAEYSEFTDANILASRAYEHGYPCALYSHGKNIRKDRPEEALRDFEAAKRLVLHFVDLGDEEAIRCAAEMFERGFGFECDTERAKAMRDALKRQETEKVKRRQNRSSELYVQAMDLLYEMNEHVIACDQDENQFLESVVLLLERATRLGNPYAEWQLGILIKEKNSSLSEMYCDEARNALKALSAAGDAKATNFIEANQICSSKS